MLKDDEYQEIKDAILNILVFHSEKLGKISFASARIEIDNFIEKLIEKRQCQEKE